MGNWAFKIQSTIEITQIQKVQPNEVLGLPSDHLPERQLPPQESSCHYDVPGSLGHHKSPRGLG